MRIIRSIMLLMLFQSVQAQNIAALHELHPVPSHSRIQKFNNNTLYWFSTSIDSITLDGVARWHKFFPNNPFIGQAYFTVIDSNQQWLLDLRFISRSSIIAYALNTDVDSNFLLAFNYYGDTLQINDTVLVSNNDGKGALCVTKIKKDGSIAFCKSFQGYPVGAQIAALPNGKTVVSGSTSYAKMIFDGQVLPSLAMGSVSNTDMFVAILDSTGQVLHVKRFGGFSWDYCDHLLTTDDGSIYLSGDFYSSPFQIDSLILTSQGGGKFGLPDALLLKLDSTLRPIWARQVRGWGGQRGMVIDMDALGRLYWGFEFTNYHSYLEEDTLHGGLDNVMICQLDTAGTIIWKRSLATENDGYFSGLTFDPDHNFWLSIRYQDSLRFGGHSLPGVGKWDYALVKMNPEGEFLRWFNITGPSWENIDHLQAIGNQQLFISGSADSLSFLNLNIAADPVYQRTYFHFILDLNTVGTQETVPDVLNLSVFPNPIQAGGLLRVVLQGAFSNGQVRLYDALGRIVAQTQVPDYAAQMNFPAPRQPGLYYLVLQVGAQRAVSKIVVGR